MVKDRSKTEQAACVTLVALLLSTLLAALAAGRLEAQSAKLVGVVFDDSGSMAGRTNLPVFGIQMLATSLTDKDRLFGMTFKQYFGAYPVGSRVDLGQPVNPRVLTEFSLRSPPERRRNVDTLRSWALNPSVNTPYEPVELMIKHLADAARPNDDIHFFLFTDGEFNPSDAFSAAQQRLTALRDKAKAAGAHNFTVHLIAFNPEPTAREAIRRQGVLPMIASVFNGDPATNVYFPQRFEELRSALIKTIATISETDVEPAVGSSGGGQTSVLRAGAKVEIKPPFTVSRVIIVATAPSQSGIPQLKDWPKAEAPVPEDYTAAMAQADTPAKAGGGANVLWQGKVTHIAPHPPLPANKAFTLEFDRAIGEETTLLFRTDIAVEFEIIDSQSGAAIKPDQGGIVALATGQAYEVRARLIDKNDKDAQNNPKEVLLKDLPKETVLEFKDKDDQGREQRRRMTIDPALNRAVLKGLTYSSPRPSDDVSVSVRLPGFVTAQDRGLKINVVTVDADVLLSTRPEIQCPACSAKRVEPVVTGQSPFAPAMTASARFKSRGPADSGVLTLSLDKPLPSGARARIAATGEILEGPRVSLDMPFRMSDDVDVVFEVDGRFLQTRPAGIRPTLVVRLQSPLVGGGSATFDIVPRLEQPRLVFAGTTDGKPGDTPLRIKPDELDRDVGFYVRVTGAHEPPAVSDLSASIDGLAAVISQDPRNKEIFKILVRSAAWCNCFIDTGDRGINIKFGNKDGQEATLRGHMTVLHVTWMERFLLCLAFLILVLTGMWLTWGVWRYLTSWRFPRTSRMLFYKPGRRRDHEYKALASRPWPWIKPFIPFMNPNEQRSVMGLLLQAGPDGVRVLAKSGGYAQIKKTTEPTPLSRHFENGAREPVALYWGDKLEEISRNGQIFEFVEKPGD